MERKRWSSKQLYKKELKLFHKTKLSQKVKTMPDKPSNSLRSQRPFRAILVSLLSSPLVFALILLCGIPLWSRPAHAGAGITARVTMNTYAAFISQNTGPGELIFFRSNASHTNGTYDEVPNNNNARLTISGNVTNSTVNLGTTAGYFMAGFNDKARSAQASYCTISPIDFFTPQYLGAGGSIDVTVTCTIPDTTPPVLQNGNVNAVGTTLTLNYNENVSTDYGDPSYFSVTAGGLSVGVSSLSSSGSSVILGLSTSIQQGQVVQVTYSGQSDEAVTDTSWNDAADYTNYPVTNNSTVSGAATAPTATTGAATGISATGATLNGTINDNGASTAVTFNYGLTTGYGTNVAATTPSGGTVAAGSGSTAVAKTLAGLTCNSTYHYRVSGLNTGGTSNGSDTSFTTSACASPPAISANPGNSTVNSGANASFTVTATGTGLSYQWKVSSDGGTTYNNLTNTGIYTNVTTATLNLTGATSAVNGNLYQCVVSGSASPSATSTGATLTVNPPPAISANPGNSTVSSGGNTSFSVTATGAGLSYQWKVSTDGGTTYNNLTNTGIYTNVTTATLNLTGATTAVNGNLYQCVVSGSAGPSATSTGATLTVNKAATSTTVVSSVNPSIFGQSVTLSASVAATAPGGGAPTGTVSFYDGVTLLGAGTISGGSASLTTSAFNAASHSITAVYGGATSYLVSTSDALAQTVNKAAPLLTWLAPFPIPAGTLLDIRELNASANIPGTFVYSPAAGAAVSAGAGQTLSVTFTPGDALNYTSASMSVSLDVQKLAQAITFPAPAAKLLTDASFALAAAADSGLTVSYTSSNPAVATVAGSTVTITGAGVTTITASQAGNSSYAAAASVNQPLVVGYSGSAPTLSVLTLLDGSRTRTATINVSGSATGQNGIKTILVNGTPVALGADNSFSLALVLSEGNNNVTVTVIDNAGLESTETRSIILDTAAPVVTVISPADNATLAASLVTLTGTLDNPGTVQVTVNGGVPQAATMNGNGFSVDLPLLPGSNTIQVTATDLAGNTSSVSRTLVSDTASPSLAITAPGQDISTDLSSVSIGGTFGDNLTPVTITVAVDGVSFTPEITGGAFLQTLDLPLAKQYAITVTATDRAGNSVTVQRNVIRRGTPAITWAPPAALVYGAVLGAGQQNATASVPGTFSYSPASGTVLGAGSGQTLSVTFTPTDIASYAPVTVSVSVDVYRAAPAITWAGPGAVNYGTALSPSQLNATASVPGSFSYAPPAGTVLGAGKGQSLSATFTPTNANYAPVSMSVLLDVNQATPAVAWATPAPIVYGTALDSTQLNATASVPGSFTYTPATGIVMNGGAAQTLTVVFVPTDMADYQTVTKSVVIDVNRAQPVITWSNPPAIVYGTQLGVAQLSATANVVGTFSYSPPAGTLLVAGAGQVITATFTPSNAVKYTTATRSVSIAVNRATPLISWNNPAPLSFGTPLGATQLNATASVPGSFVYTPASGTLLGSGAGQTLSVTFTPNDSANYAGSAASVAIDVARSTQVISFAPPAARLINDAPFELAATSSSGLAVSFASSDSSVATVSGSTVTIRGAGTCTISASQAGDASFAPAAGVNRPLVVRYAAQLPQLSLSALPDGTVTHAATLNITGSATSQNGIRSVIVNGTPVELNSDNGFSLVFIMSEGRNRFVISALDNAGLESSDERSITLDTAAPAITVSAPPDNSALSATSANVTGYLDNPGQVSATVNGGSPQAASMNGSTFSVSLNLANGSNTVLLTGTDLAGNSSTVKRTIISDVSKPTLAVSAPGADSTINAVSMVLSGTVSDDLGTPVVTITLDGQSFTPQVTSGGFQQQLSLPTAKTYAITVSAVDQAGNSSTVQRNVIRPRIWGDLTHDGKVDVADALKALQMAVGLITPSADDLAVGDVAPLAGNQPQPDGAIDIEDALAILKKAVGTLNF